MDVYQLVEWFLLFLIDIEHASQETCRSKGLNEKMIMEGDFTVDLMDHTHGSYVTDSASFPRPRGGASSYEQRFLLFFILGAYFGPDVTTEVPRKSALQREAEDLPPYTSDMLGGSVFRLSDIESIYYYILRSAHPSARVKLQSLYKFLQGHLAPPIKKMLEDERQFPSFFPPHLHRHSRYKGTYKVVENLVFIDSPDVSLLKVEDVEIFKRLSRLTDLAVDRHQARIYQHGQRNDRDEERSARYNPSLDCDTSMQVVRPVILPNPASESQKKKRRKGQPEFLSPSTSCSPKEEKPYVAPNRNNGAAMLLLPAFPTLEQLNDMMNAVKPVLAFTGTAAACQAGPLIGLVDVYECDDAYLFRCSLPGVKKQENDFSCEVEGDGKVTIHGTTTTGETRIYKDSRVFTTLTQCLSPPGPFSISFYLPGPVEPLSPTANFRNDGILEGVVLKRRARVGTASLTFES